MIIELCFAAAALGIGAFALRNRFGNNRQLPARDAPAAVELEPAPDTKGAFGVTPERLQRHLDGLDRIITGLSEVKGRVQKKKNIFHFKIGHLAEAIRKLKANLRADPADLDAMGPLVPTLDELLRGAQAYAALADYQAADLQPAKEKFEGEVTRAITAFATLLVKLQENNALEMTVAVDTVRAIYPDSPAARATGNF